MVSFLVLVTSKVFLVFMFFSIDFFRFRVRAFLCFVCIFRFFLGELCVGRDRGRFISVFVFFVYFLCGRGFKCV